jgi:cbb3-type cytochrome oxidase maturation protein
MDEGTIALTVMSGSLLLIFLGLFIWGIKNGQFKNVEEPKYRMLENEEKQEQRDNKGGKS